MYREFLAGGHFFIHHHGCIVVVRVCVWWPLREQWPRPTSPSRPTRWLLEKNRNTDQRVEAGPDSGKTWCPLRAIPNITHLSGSDVCVGYHCQPRAPTESKLYVRDVGGAGQANVLIPSFPDVHLLTIDSNAIIFFFPFTTFMIIKQDLSKHWRNSIYFFLDIRDTCNLFHT